MQESGAIAVVVGDNAPHFELVTMYASQDSTNVTIPSVFIAQWSYQYLLTLIDDNSDKMDSLQGLRIHLYQNGYQLSLYAMLSILLLLPIMLLFVFWCLYWLGTWIRRRREISLIKRDIVNIPIVSFSSKERQENDPETCVCFLLLN